MIQKFGKQDIMLRLQGQKYLTIVTTLLLQGGKDPDGAFDFTFLFLTRPRGSNPVSL